jgi:hypothetical protein
MIDIFPNKIASYSFAVGMDDIIYTDLEEIEQWTLSTDSLARDLGLDCDLSPFMYAPFVAAMLSPAGHLPARWWRDILLIINIGFVFVFACQILILCEVKISWRGLLWALTLILICYPLARAAKLGQVVPLLAAVFWMGVLLLKRWEVGGGILIGAIGAIKLFPIAIIPVLILQKRYRAALSALISIIVIYAISFMTIGVELHQRWWRMMVDFGNVVIPYFGNQSLPAWIARLGFNQKMDDVEPVTDPLFVWIRLLIVVVIAGITIWILWQARKYELQKGLEIRLAFAFAGILLATATAWEHYWLFVLPVLGYVIYEVWIRGDVPFWEWWLALTVFFFTMKLTRFYVDTPLGGLISGSQTLGMLMLWIWFWRRLWGSRAIDSIVST